MVGLLRAVLRRTVRVRRSPLVALILVVLLTRELSQLSPRPPVFPGVVAAGATVTSSRGLCYLVREGGEVRPASLLEEGAYERRIGTAYRVGRHVRTFDEVPTYEDVGFTVELRGRDAQPLYGASESLARECLDLAEAEWAAAAARPTEVIRDVTVYSRPALDPRVVRGARVALFVVLTTDSLLGVGAWWGALVEWDRRSRRRADEEERRRAGMCRECGYPTEGLPTGRCPECGVENTQ